MTTEEKARKILENKGSCTGFVCDGNMPSDICPCHESLHDGKHCDVDDLPDGTNYYCVKVCEEYLAKLTNPVNHPSHYAGSTIECIEAIKASMTQEAFCGYLKGNVGKYLWRYEKKVAPAEDLKKASWYLTRLIEEVDASN